MKIQPGMGWLGRPALFVLAALLLSACASTPQAEGPPAPAAVVQPDPEPPKLMHELSAECWMKIDKMRVGIDQRAKAVDKCIDEKMKGAKPPAAR